MNPSTLLNSIEELTSLIEWLNEVNQDPKHRDRKLSLAITNLETGMLWLGKYNREKDWNE